MINNIIILAAGKGTRLKSKTVKVLHPLAHTTIIQHVIDSTAHLNDTDRFVVVGHQAKEVEASITQKNITFVEQTQQLGTGHAVQQVIPFLQHKSNNTTLILTGDTPLINPQTLTQLQNIHKKTNAAASILTTKFQDPTGYGRILKDNNQNVIGIREHKDCNDKEKEIKEINSGIYMFNTEELLDNIFKLSTENKQKEYYLTDIIQILQEKGKTITTYCTSNNNEILGINTRQDLAKATQLHYDQNNQYFMTNGVTIKDPKSTFIDKTVHIEKDSVIEPFTIIKGATQIGTNCTIGPFVELNDITIKNNETIKNTHNPQSTNATL